MIAQQLPLKVLAKINARGLKETTNANQLIKYIDIGSVTDKGFNGEYQNFKFSEAPSRARRLVQNGSTIIATVRTYLKAVAYMEKPDAESVISTGFAVLDPSEKVFPKFLYYRVVADDFVQRVEANSVGVSYPAISPSTFGSMKVEIPISHTQQMSIVNFLDHKIGLIDQIVSKKQNLIDLLQEKRAALITRAITKGLNPKVKMKDSQIEWAGEIPADWLIKPLFSIVKENHKKNIELKNINLLSLSYGRIIKKDIASNSGLLPESFSSYQVVTQGNVILRLTDLQNDHKSLRVGLVSEVNGIITSAYTGLIATRSIRDDYLYYVLHGYDLLKVFYAIGGGVRQSIDFKQIGKLPIILPISEEQEKIVQYLNTINRKIDKIIASTKISIIQFEEYRSSLIYHAVTGKIKV